MSRPIDRDNACLQLGSGVTAVKIRSVKPRSGMSMKVEDWLAISSAVLAVSQHPPVFELDLLVPPVCCHALSIHGWVVSKSGLAPETPRFSLQRLAAKVAALNSALAVGI